MKDTMNKAAAVSVIMPVYNTESYLKTAVESVIGQSFSGWELILIDDGSTDSSGEICDSFAAADPRIRVIHRENGGLSAARNTGLGAAAGEYVRFLDSDDWLSPDALEVLLKTAAGSQADMVIFDVQYEWNDHSMHERPPLAPGKYGPEFILEKLSVPSIPPYACNKFCLRSLYDGVLFPEGEKWEDVATVIYPVSRAAMITVIDRPLYHYRQRDDAITKLAIQDGSIHKWRFLQYAKRYAFLMANYPGIAAAARGSLIRNGLLYYSYCLRGREYQNERKRVLSFIRSPEMGQGLPGLKLRLVRKAFCMFPHLAAFLFRAWHTLRSFRKN